MQQLLATLCDKVGLGNKADRYRSQAINEMRNLGDRRATAELLLTEMPNPADLRRLVDGAPAQQEELESLIQTLL